VCESRGAPVLRVGSTILGSLASSAGQSRLQISIPAAIPGRMACLRGYRVGDPLLYRHSLPRYADKLNTYFQPLILGEIAFMLWLVIKGAKPHRR
jgi:hypothetical protein